MSKATSKPNDKRERLVALAEAYGKFASIFSAYAHKKQGSREQLLAALSIADFYMVALYREYSKPFAPVPAPPVGRPQLRLLPGGKPRSLAARLP